MTRIVLIALSIITPLCSAMHKKRAAILKEPIIEYTSLPLHHAAMHQNHTQLAELLKSGLYVINALDHSARSPLHHACESSAVECAKLLLENGADAMQKSLMGYTALHFAVTANNVELIELLLKHSPKLINQLDMFKKTALHCAAHSGNMYSIHALLQRNPDCNAQDVLGNTPLHLLLHRSTTHISQAEFVDLVRAFIDLGVDCTIQNNEGNTPLHVYVAINSSPTTKVADLLKLKTGSIQNNAGQTWIDIVRARFKPKPALQSIS